MEKILDKNLNFKFRGVVVKGNQIGRTIGFPTANLNPIDTPNFPTLNGVYSVFVYLNNEVYFGAMNVGTKPTFEHIEHTKSYEVHIFDFSQTIYGEILEIEVCSFIRNEKKFQSVDLLKKQLEKDCTIAKQDLKNFGKHKKLYLNLLNSKELSYPDLAFARLCEERFRVNRGIYNIVDNYFFENGYEIVEQRREKTIQFLNWVTVLLPKSENIKFGNNGVSEQLNFFLKNIL